MKKRITLSIFTILLLGSSASYAGGGWPQKKGHGYFKIGFWWLRSDQYFAPNGEIIDIATAGVHTASIYGEYGITDRLTGVIYFPFFSRATLNRQVSGVTGDLLVDGDAVNSLGDTDISIKYGLLQNTPVVVSASLTLGLPLGNEAGGDTQVLQTGDGEFNQMISIEASRSFPSIGAYATVLVGYNNRTKSFSDEFRYGVEAGVTVKNFTLLGRLYGVESLQNGSDEEAPSNGIFSNNIEYTSFTPELIYTYKEKYGVTASVGTAFSGRRVLATPSYSFGLFMKL
ncbi:hypothetical protein QQ020_17240 [Fulvivirgaceae bacterium BMA12]|uniref:Transporter n=1 Tax=Agaribacillus aureus TaxID=3051825 RepID=A0ABT8L7T4_9BACT|nr:hypothetical protein [Fulvivirgaceae bacterium BMA12]